MSGRTYFGSEANHLDLQQMTAYAGIPAAQRIIDEIATPEDVMDWYGSDDPVSEEMNRMILASTNRESLAAAMNVKTNYSHIEGTLNLCAATILLRDLADYPDLKELSQEREGSTQVLLAEVALSSIRPDELEKYHAAADCLHAAGSCMHDFVRRMSNRGVSASRKQDVLLDAGLELRHLGMALGANVLATMRQQDIALQQEHQTDMFHMEQLLLRIAPTIPFREGVGYDELPQYRDQMIRRVLEVINHYFYELDDRNVIKGEQKGNLHEILCFLDLVYLTHSGKDLTTVWSVLPSALRQDKPKSGGHLSKNRGIDFTASNGMKTIPLQAKASPHHDKEYHPWIVKAVEDNFQYSDKGRLTKKVEAYQKLLETGDDTLVRKYLLPSAQDSYNHIVEIDQMSMAEFHVYMLGQEQSVSEKDKQRIAAMYGAAVYINGRDRKKARKREAAQARRRR